MYNQTILKGGYHEEIWNKKLKEIRFRPRIADHDLKIRKKQAKNFLEKGHRVKVTVIFWGRKFSDRKAFMKDAEQRLKVFESLGKVVSPVKMNGSNYSMILESVKKKE